MYTINLYIITRRLISPHNVNVIRNPPTNKVSSHLECMLTSWYGPRPSEQHHPSQGTLVQQWLSAIHREDSVPPTIQDLLLVCSAVASATFDVDVARANTPSNKNPPQGEASPSYLSLSPPPPQAQSPLGAVRDTDIYNGHGQNFAPN